jgi:hypothetical protein
MSLTSAEVDVQLACTIDESDPDERAMREYTDDQAFHIGYAIGTPATRWLPMEAHLAWLLRDALLKLTVEDRTLGSGPDGKLLIALRPAGVGSGGFVRYTPARMPELLAAPTSWCA